MEEKQAHAHAGHRGRLKARFLKEGLDAFEEHNALELLLFYAIPQRDTNELAHKLIAHFGSFSAVFDAPVEALMQVDGIGESAAILLKLMPAVYGKYLQNKQDAEMLILKTAEAAGEYLLPQFVGKDTERFLAICMNHKCKVIKTVVISDGTQSATEIRPRKLAEAVIHTNATQVILAHNHPQGVAAPSAHDIEATRYLISMLKNLGVKLSDHIIVAGDNLFSMATSPKFKGMFL